MYNSTHIQPDMYILNTPACIYLIQNSQSKQEEKRTEGVDLDRE